MANELLEFLIRGILLGVVYGLIAMPLTWVFVATDTVDLAIGGYAVLAAAVTAAAGGVAGIAAGIAAGTLVSAIMGLVFVAIARKGRLDPISVVLASFGLITALTSLVLWRWGKDPFIDRALTGTVDVLGVPVRTQGVLNLAIAVFLVAAVTYGLNATPVGRSLRASAIRPAAAVIAGIPVLRLQFFTFIGGGLIASTAGILIYYSTGLTYSSGLHLALVGLSAAVVFGMRSPAIGFLGGLTIGVVEAMAGGYLSGAVASAVPMIVILAALLSGRLGTTSMAGARP